jgi:hypothetical protein
MICKKCQGNQDISLYLNYKQYDPKWANLTIRGTNLKIKDWGCALCSLTNLVNKFSYAINPAQLNEKIDYVKGLIVWSSINKIFPKVKFIKSVDYSKIPADLNYVKRLLDQGIPIIAETRTGLFKNKTHFVTIWGYDHYVKKFTMSDPASDKIYFEDKYGKPDRWIYSIKIFNLLV